MVFRVNTLLESAIRLHLLETLYRYLCIVGIMTTEIGSALSALSVYDRMKSRVREPRVPYCVFVIAYSLYEN